MFWQTTRKTCVTEPVEGYLVQVVFSATPINEYVVLKHTVCTRHPTHHPDWINRAVIRGGYYGGENS